MFGFDGEYSAVHPEAKFWHISLKGRKKSAVEQSIENPILLNFVNLFRTFCPRLYLECATLRDFSHRKILLQVQYVTG